MPKGVEHHESARQSGVVKEVVKPQMPKGVEHYKVVNAERTAKVVVKPQMPKGVEHYEEALQQTGFGGW